MIYALSPESLCEASPDLGGVCPLCKTPVIAKCGEIRVWHWAHVSCADCDTWSEGETLWHKAMKEIFPPNRREIIIGNHRADIETLRGLVIECQHSPITAEEVREREEFYGNMLWIVDAREWEFNQFNLHSVWLKRQRPSWAVACRPIILDLGPVLLLVADGEYLNTFKGNARRIEKQDLFRELSRWEGDDVPL